MSTANGPPELPPVAETGPEATFTSAPAIGTSSTLPGSVSSNVLSTSPAAVPIDVTPTAAHVPVPLATPATSTTVNTSEVIAEKQVREASPQGRYIKLEDRLGSGAYKDV